MKYLTKSINKYLKDLASNKPAPGGGSASALTASLGVSLLLMVANFTVGKKAYKKYEASIKKIIDQLSANKLELEVLIDEDVRVYKRVAGVLNLLKSARRKRLLQTALKNAAKVPFSVCEISNASLKSALTMLHKGNRNLLTDVGCGAFFLQSAFIAARLNADINLKYIEDKKFVKRLKRSLDAKNGIRSQRVPKTSGTEFIERETHVRC